MPLGNGHMTGADHRDTATRAPPVQFRHLEGRPQSGHLGKPRRNQRAAGCAAGAGGGPAAVGGLGFFGRIGLRTVGGGVAGLSSANTGLGSMMVVAGEVESPGFRITWTGTVTGWNLGIAKVTEKPASGAGTLTEQGVLQAGPSEVVASAPGGADSSATWTAGGAGFNQSNENEEHPARLAPVTAIATARRMIEHSDWRQDRHNPESANHRSARIALQSNRENSLKNG